MGLEVKVLDLGDIELDTSFLVLALEPGQAQQVPTLGFLITGGEAPIVVDTGFSDPSIMGNLGMTGWWRGEQGMEKQLARHGLEMKDVRYVLHTHLHIDHAGYDDRFAMDGTTVVINRRELERLGPALAPLLGVGMARAQDVALTARERELLESLEEGLRFKQIARRLGISEATAKTHARNLFRKLDATSRAEAVHAARERGLFR